MNLRSLGYIVDTVEVTRAEELARVLKQASRKPVEIKLPKDLFSTLETYLRKSRYFYMITSASEYYVAVTVSAPEALLMLDSDVHPKSYKLSNPLVLHSLLLASEVVATGRVSSQLDLVKLLLSKQHGIWLYMLVSDEYYGRAYLLTSGSKVVGVVYMDALTYYGIVALRLLFYRLPFRYVLYSVKT